MGILVVWLLKKVKFFEKIIVEKFAGTNKSPYLCNAKEKNKVP